MTTFEAFVIAVVEGITEYLPISSTGHMILAQHLLHVPHSNFTKVFTVAIQLGAILSVVVLYWRKFITPLTEGKNGWLFYAKLLVGVLPALILGKLFDEKIESLLESPLTVSITLFAGGFILLFIDRIFNRHTTTDTESLSFSKAFIIGIWQCISMIPGVSRSAASIIGGMQQKLSRSFAAEFSFFLAVPTMAAATGYSLFLKDWKENDLTQKGYEIILGNQAHLQAFIVGNIVAFIVAMLAIKFFIGFLQKHGFRFFGWYRIIVGGILLAFILTGAL